MFRKLTVLLIILSQSAYSQDHYELATRNFYDLQYVSALEHINLALESDDVAENFLLRAVIYEAMGNNTNAHDDYVKAITLEKNYYEAYFQFSEFMFATHEYERAIAGLNFLVNRMDRGDTRAVFVKYDAHGDEATQLTTLVGMKAEVLQKRGLAFQKLGQYDKAIQDFDGALAIGETVDKYVNRALLFIEMGLKNRAENDLKKAIDLNVNSALAWYNLLILNPKIDLPVLMDKEPDFAPMLSLKGIEAFDSNDLISASKLFGEALLLTPNDPILLLNAGRLDQRNKNYQAAHSKFIRVLSLAPEKYKALYLLGNSYYGLREFRNALNYYEQFLKTDPTNAQIWFNSAMTYLELKENENACMCLMRSSDLGMNESAPFISEYCTKE